MQAIMSNYVGIVRSNLSLERALRRLSIIYEETEELHNKIKPNREAVRTAQHDRRGLPGHQTGQRIERIGRLPLQLRLPQTGQ